MASNGEFLTPKHGVQNEVLQSCADIAVGDDVEAWHRDRLFHRGRVTNVLPEMGLLWIRDARTGTRKLLDFAELRIMRVPSPEAAKIS